MTCHDHRLLPCPSPQASLPAETLGDDLHGIVDQRYSRLNSKLNGVPMDRLCTNARGKKPTRWPDQSNSECILPRWTPGSFEDIRSVQCITYIVVRVTSRWTPRRFVALIRSCYDIHSIALNIQCSVAGRAVSKQLDSKAILMLLHCSEVSMSLILVNTGMVLLTSMGALRHRIGCRRASPSFAEQLGRLLRYPAGHSSQACPGRR